MLKPWIPDSAFAGYEPCSGLSESFEVLKWWFHTDELDIQNIQSRTKIIDSEIIDGKS